MFFPKIVLPSLLLFFLIIQPAFAVNFEEFSGLKKIAGENAAGYDTSKVDLMRTIGTGIQYALSFLGVVMICIVLIGYFIMSSAGGDEEKVKKAKGWIKNGIIGILIVLAAYLLTAAFLGFFANGVFDLEKQ